MMITLDESVKAMPLFFSLDKEYEGTMLMHSEYNVKELKDMINKKFIGKIIQTPPKRSAVKRKPRERTIYSFEIIRTKGNIVFFRVSCEAGTYIRKLCHDIGKESGYGAHITSLKRIRIGVFTLSEAAPLHEIERSKELHKFAVPIENVIERVVPEKVIVKKDALRKIRNGTPLNFSDISYFNVPKDYESSFPIYDEEGRLLAIGTLLGNPEKEKKKIIKVDRVFKY